MPRRTRPTRGNRPRPRRRRAARLADDGEGLVRDGRDAHDRRRPDLAGYVPARDADAVARLRAAGAIVMGKTNLPTFAMDWQTYNPVFGTTNNPWDLTRTPGGSSGGAAAAVAAGLTALELGSDIRGSLRQPAHNMRDLTLKPSYGSCRCAATSPARPARSAHRTWGGRPARSLRGRPRPGARRTRRPGRRGSDRVAPAIADPARARSRRLPDRGLVGRAVAPVDSAVLEVLASTVDGLGRAGAHGSTRPRARSTSRGQCGVRETVPGRRLVWRCRLERHERASANSCAHSGSGSSSPSTSS